MNSENPDLMNPDSNPDLINPDDDNLNSIDVNAISILVNGLKSREEEIKKSNKRNELLNNILNELVTHIKTKLYPKTMMDNDEIVLYFDGYYHQNGDKYIRTMCGKTFGEYYNGSMWKIVLDKIRAISTIERKFFKEPSTKINLRNGVLDVRTLNLEVHNPKYNFLNKININYNPDATCPKIENFLREATSSEEDFLCLQEYIGFTLYPEYIFDKFLVIHGSGGHNRKTKTFSIITKLLGGQENVSSSSLQALSKDRFECSQLYGKKANICGDIKSEKIEFTGEIKRLLGYDDLTAQRKHERQFQFINKAKLLFSCNSLPVIEDDTTAWWNKVLLLCFEKGFSNDPSDLVERITTESEMEGFLIFALLGLNRLLKNEKFTYNHDLTQVRWEDLIELETEWDDEEFTISRFQDAKFIIENNPLNLVSRDVLYEMFKNFNGHSKMTMKQFSRYICQLGDIKLIRKGLNGKRIKLFTNIKLKENIEAKENINDTGME